MAAGMGDTQAEALHAARQRELDEKAAELSSVAAERDALAQRLSEQRLAMLLLEVEGAEAVERLQVKTRIRSLSAHCVHTRRRLRVASERERTDSLSEMDTGRPCPPYPTLAISQGMLIPTPTPIVSQAQMAADEQAVADAKLQQVRERLRVLWLAVAAVTLFLLGVIDPS